MKHSICDSLGKLSPEDGNSFQSSDAKKYETQAAHHAIGRFLATRRPDRLEL
jgi:hypothetical protein